MLVALQASALSVLYSTEAAGVTPDMCQLRLSCESEKVVQWSGMARLHGGIIQDLLDHWRGRVAYIPLGT
jgi:hypothetical protein